MQETNTSDELTIILQVYRKLRPIDYKIMIIRFEMMVFLVT